MITENELKEVGYTVLKRGAWIRLDPGILSNDWELICADLKVDPNCDEIIVAISGVKTIFKRNEE